MKAFLLSLLCLFCLGCTEQRQKKAVQLCNDLKSVPILSSKFDSLMEEVYTLPVRHQVDILLGISRRHETKARNIEKQKTLLIRTLDFAPTKKRKEVLYQLIKLYQALDGFGFLYATSEGVKYCVELEDNYALSKEEKCTIKRLKIVFLNKQGVYKESLPILYNLLKEHRDAGETTNIIEDLTAIANYFDRLGDQEKALSVYKDAYQLTVDNQMYDLQKTYLVPIVNISYNLKKYDEVINLYNDINIDSIITPPVYSTLSLCYLHLQKPDSARFFLAKMISSSQRGYGSVLYCKIAETYISEDKEDSAAFYLNEAVRKVEAQKKFHKDISLPLYFMQVYASYGSLLQRNGKLKQADDVFHLIEPLMKDSATSTIWLEQKMNALYRYGSFCQSTKQYKKATELLMYRDSVQKVYYKNKESLDSKNEIERFNNLELVYENQVKDAEINFSHRFSAVLFVCIIFFFLCLAICSLILYWGNKKIRKYRNLLMKQNSEPITSKKREPLNPQKQLYEAAQRMVKTQKLFQNNFLTLDELAEKLGTNRSSLSSCINTYSKNNFNQWINNYRIEYAMERIMCSDNLRALSVEAGFKSYGTFCSSFKERFHCTPSEYVKTHKYDTL